VITYIFNDLFVPLSRPIITLKSNTMAKLVNPEAISRSAAANFADFIECYSVPQHAKHKLWELLIAAMGSKHADMWDGEQRADMLFFVEQCNNVFDAVYENRQQQED
jgi:hypothetical protein